MKLSVKTLHFFKEEIGLRICRGLCALLIISLVTACHSSSDSTATATSSPPPVPTPGIDGSVATATPVPRATCGPGSRHETGIQGRVSQQDHVDGLAEQGFTCNTELIGEYTIPNARGTVGGYKVERYIDKSGRECAYYDTTLLFPTNLFSGQSGVNVLDMSDPTQPVLTTTLQTPAMLSPHESLSLNQQRGLLIAVLGNPVFYPGVVDIYDVSEDCRYPVLQSTSPLGFLGHEGAFTPDGKTYYSASPATPTLAAIDVSNPGIPILLTIIDVSSHGLSFNDDGTRAYIAGVGLKPLHNQGLKTDRGLVILDTSDIQNRERMPQTREIARLTWAGVSTPQYTIPVAINGRSFLIEVDEFGALDSVGAARIIDIEDEKNPKIISNVRLEVHQQENFETIAEDPGADSTALASYAAHYCNVPRRTEPHILACSMILSGLRIFDIRDPYNPKEIAYFNAPRIPKDNWAMSSPAFVPERKEIWYTDGNSGFYVIRVTNNAWPD